MIEYEKLRFITTHECEQYKKEAFLLLPLISDCDVYHLHRNHLLQEYLTTHARLKSVIETLLERASKTVINQNLVDAFNYILVFIEKEGSLEPQLLEIIDIAVAGKSMRALYCIQRLLHSSHFLTVEKVYSALLSHFKENALLNAKMYWLYKLAPLIKHVQLPNIKHTTLPEASEIESQHIQSTLMLVSTSIPIDFQCSYEGQLEMRLKNVVIAHQFFLKGHISGDSYVDIYITTINAYSENETIISKQFERIICSLHSDVSTGRKILRQIAKIKSSRFVNIPSISRGLSWNIRKSMILLRSARRA